MTESEMDTNSKYFEHDTHMTILLLLIKQI